MGYAIGFFGRLLKGAASFIIRGRVSRKILVMQILFTCVEALGITSLLALGLGAIVNGVIMPLFVSLSQAWIGYPVLITLITRELGPLLTAIIVISRSATAIAAEIAGIVINHEAEAYVSVGIDPIEHLGAPRFWGVTLSLILLNIYFSIFGLAASFLAAQIFNPLPASVYFNNLLNYLTIADLVTALVKSVVFGVIISAAALYAGFSVERASTEVPVAALKAVSRSMAFCIAANFALSLVYYLVSGGFW
jgi:phospholipid/cholesterol/gamma-HCH transport system permease protein